MDKLLYTSLIALGFLAVSATASTADVRSSCRTLCNTFMYVCLGVAKDVHEDRASCASAANSCEQDCVAACPAK